MRPRLPTRRKNVKKKVPDTFSVLYWGKPPQALPESWTYQRPATGIVGQSQLDAVLLNWGAAIDTSLAGDFNGNGAVEQSDLDLVLIHWGLDASSAPNSWVVNRPIGQIDQGELDAVLLNWGASSPVSAASIAPPVPSGLREAARTGDSVPFPKLAKPLPGHARDFAFDAFPPTALDQLLAASLV